MGSVQSLLLLLDERIGYGLPDYGRRDDQDQHVSRRCLPAGNFWCILHRPELLVRPANARVPPRLACDLTLFFTVV